MTTHTHLCMAAIDENPSSQPFEQTKNIKPFSQWCVVRGGCDIPWENCTVWGRDRLDVLSMNNFSHISFYQNYPVRKEREETTDGHVHGDDYMYAFTRIIRIRRRRKLDEFSLPRTRPGDKGKTLTKILEKRKINRVYVLFHGPDGIAHGFLMVFVRGFFSYERK